MKNGKERWKKRKRLQGEGATQSQEEEDIEESAMKEDDLSKLGYCLSSTAKCTRRKGRPRMRESRNEESCKTAKKRSWRRLTDLKDECHGKDSKRILGKQSLRDIPTSSRECAWDDFNNMELTMTSSRGEEGGYDPHEGEHTPGCEAGRSIRENGETADQYERGRH